MAGNNFNIENLEKNYGRTSIWQIIFSDAWRKLVALVLGGLCWWAIRGTLKNGDAVTQHWFSLENIPVSVQDTHNGERYYFERNGLQSHTVDNVTLELGVDFWHQGTKVKPEEFTIQLQPYDELISDNDKCRIEPMEFEYTLQTMDVKNKPSDVFIRGFLPKTIKFKWDKYTTREVPIHVDLRNWRASTRTFEVKLKPDTVIVSGPEFQVNQIEDIKTDAIELKEDMPDFTSEYELVMPSGLDACRFDRNTVEVMVNFYDSAVMNSKRIGDIRVDILNRTDANLSVSMDSNGQSSKEINVVSAIVIGPVDKVNALDKKSLVAFCDLTPYSDAGIYNVKVQLLGLPPDVTANIHPDFVKFNLVSANVTKAAAGGGEEIVAQVKAAVDEARAAAEQAKSAATQATVGADESKAAAAAAKVGADESKAAAEQAKTAVENGSGAQQ